MPDVGVLNLQIHDDSEKAAEGLDNLVGVLNRVKDACNFGRNLGTVATNLDRLSKVINESIQGSTISKLREMTAALEKLQGIRNVNIRISYGKNGKGDIASDMNTAMGNIQYSVDSALEGFAQVSSRIDEVRSGVSQVNGQLDQMNALVQNVAWSAGDMAEKLYQAFSVWNKIRMSRSIGSGTSQTLLGDGTGGSGAGWTYWKDGAIEAEGTVSDAAENIYGYIEGVQLRLTGVVEETKEAAKVTTSEYKAACEEALKDAQKLNSEIANKFRTLPKRTIEDYYHGMRFERQEDGTDKKVQVKDILTEQLRGMGTPNEQLYAFQTVAKELGMTVEEVKAKIEELKAAEAGIGDQATQGIDSLNSSLSVAEKFTEKARNALEKIKEAAIGLKGGFLKLFPTMTSFVSGLARIAKYRILRTILKQISAGISEGVQNVYFYSKAVGTSLAPAMDSAASALLQMKNSIGASLAPLIESLVPVLQTVVSWFIEGVNWANQFFALLRGQKTWTRAIPATANAFDDQTKAAKKAGAAIKDLLADWDELNIIQSESGGGGSIGATENATDYLKMFEEVGTFNNEVRDIVKFLKDNFGDIKETALGIGAAILGWKLSSAFEGTLGVLGKLLGEAATIYFTLKLTDSFGKEFVKTGEPGWFIADALTGAIGSTLAGMLATKIAGGAWGSITSGFTLMLAGEVNLENSRSAYAQEKIAEGQMLSILGSVEKGIGAALIAAGFTSSAPVAVGIGAAVALYSYAVNALAAVNITGVKWGENTMTPEEIQTYVTTNMLSVDIDSQVKITHAAIDLAEGEQQKLAEQATALLQPVNALKLGVNIEDSLTQIKNDVFGDGGLLAQFKSFTSAQKELVNTAETYAPTIDANGNNISGEIIKESNSAWSELNGLMDDLGADLSKHLTKAMDKTLSEELRQFEMNAVTEITDTMIRVSLAGKKATISSDALTDLAFDLSTASKGTFSDVINVYKQYVDSLTAENMELKKAEASTFASSAAMYEEFAQDALRKAGGDETDKMYLYYKGKAKHFADEYGKIMSNLAGSVEASVNEAVAPGKELVKQSIATMLAAAKEIKDGRLELFTGGKIKGLPTGWAGGLKENTSLAIQNLMFGGMNEGITEANADSLEKLYKDWLDAIIKDFMPEDFNLIKEMIDLGIIDYSDIFDADTLFQTMELQGFGKNPFYQEMWERLFGQSGADAPVVEGQVAVDPDVTVVNENEVQEKLRQAVEEAMEDGEIDAQEMVTLSTTFNADDLNKILEELGYQFGETPGGVEYEIETDASGPSSYPTSQTTYTPSNITPTGTGEVTDINVTLNESDISGGVQQGTAEGFRTLSENLGTVATWLQRLYLKELTVRYMPNTAAGLVNRASRNMVEAVTGEPEVP